MATDEVVSATQHERIDALRQQLVAAQKLSSLGALASSITHEFNNVLTTIINYSKMALREQDEAVRQRALEKILTASHRAAQLTGGILGYARQQGDRRGPAGLVALVRDVLLLAERDLVKHQVRLETEFAAEPTVVVNANQIRQVLLNLVLNARQAMPGGGQLKIAVRENAESGMAEVSIADSGVGISPENLRHIFEPFFTTKTGSTAGGGTGLGLSICRDIIEGHQGRIRVESIPGQGTTFTVKLPLATPPADSSGLPKNA